MMTDADTLQAIGTIVTQLGIGGIFIFLYLKKDKTLDDRMQDFVDYHSKRIEADLETANATEKLADTLTGLQDRLGSKEKQSEIIQAMDRLTNRIDDFIRTK